MALGEGWLIHTKTGESVQVNEHLNAILDNPKKYGVDPKLAKEIKLTKTDPSLGYRAQILTEVAQRGWMRVRLHGGSVVFEYWGNPVDAADAAQTWLKENGGPYMEVRFNNLETGRSGSATAQEILGPEGLEVFASAGRTTVQNALRRAEQVAGHTPVENALRRAERDKTAKSEPRIAQREPDKGAMGISDVSVSPAYFTVALTFTTPESAEVAKDVFENYVGEASAHAAIIRVDTDKSRNQVQVTVDVFESRFKEGGAEYYVLMLLQERLSEEQRNREELEELEKVE